MDTYYIEIFIKTLVSELSDEYHKADITYGKSDYIESRLKDVAREIVKVTNSNIDERLNNLESHTHNISNDYDGIECSCPIQ